MRHPIQKTLAIVTASAICAAHQPPASPALNSPDTAPAPAIYHRLADEMNASLQKDVLDKWFKLAIDPNGGFFEMFSDTWAHAAPARGAAPDQTRSVVYQARLTWLAAQAAEHDPARRDDYLKISRHGAAFLEDKQWDKDQGGFWWSVDVSGKPVNATEKHTYGNAFAIYALAENFRVTHDPAALELAKKAFHWLEIHAHDNKNGGYFESLTPDGTPMDATVRGNDVIGTRHGLKSMNTHIHLLEALTALFAVWPDDLVKKRMSEVFDIGLDKIYAEPGYLRLFFNPDWTVVPNRDSFGHDIETAYLLAEAAAALGKPDDPKTWQAGRHLVDHALQFGFDHDNGGFYNEGGPPEAPESAQIAREKIWWVQAEGLNALLLMHERYGRETPKYWSAFLQQWDWISRHQIDAVHGGWYHTIRPDNTPLPHAKSDSWTEGYHQGRALLNVEAMLKKLAGP